MPCEQAARLAVCDSGPMSENPADPHTEPAAAAEDGGIPSATVPGASVQPHGGDEVPEHSADGSYNDGNLGARGVQPATGRRQSADVEKDAYKDADNDADKDADKDADIETDRDADERPDDVQG